MGRITNVAKLKVNENPERLIDFKNGTCQGPLQVMTSDQFSEDDVRLAGS